MAIFYSCLFAIKNTISICLKSLDRGGKEEPVFGRSNCCVLSVIVGVLGEKRVVD